MPTHPPDDPKMWRRLIARTHPDAGGTHELFIWTGAIKAIICDGQLQAGHILARLKRRAA